MAMSRGRPRATWASAATRPTTRAERSANSRGSLDAEARQDRGHRAPLGLVPGLELGGAYELTEAQGEGREGERAARFDRLPGQLSPADATTELADLLEQTRLPNPGRSADDQAGRSAGRQSIEERLDKGELALAGDQACARRRTWRGRHGRDLGAPVCRHGLGRWIGVQVGGEGPTAELELTPGGVMAPLRGVDLDGQAVGGFVSRVVIEDLLEQGMGLAFATGQCRLCRRLHSHRLPAGPEMLARTDQPVLVGIVGQERSSAQLQHGCHSIALGIGGLISLGRQLDAGERTRARPPGLAEQLGGGPQPVQVQIEQRGLEANPVAVAREDVRQSNPSGEVERLAELIAAPDGIEVGPQRLNGQLSRHAVPFADQQQLDQPLRR